MKEKLILIQVLEGEDQALLLGRQFMHEFGRVDFDWRAGVISLGKAKLPIIAKVFGGNSEERAKTDKQITYGEALSITGKEMVSTSLGTEQKKRITGLLKSFEDTFDDKPGRTDLWEHEIKTENALPRKIDHGGCLQSGKKR